MKKSCHHDLVKKSKAHKMNLEIAKEFNISKDMTAKNHPTMRNHSNMTKRLLTTSRKKG